MKRNILKILSITILFYFFSCAKKIDTASFYLKEAYTEKEVLKFKSSKNNHQTWKVFKSKDGYIITKRLNAKNEFLDKITERITKNGSELVSYEFHQKETKKNITIYPKKKDLMKWNLNEESIYNGEFIDNGIIFNFKRERFFLEKKGDTLIFQDDFEFIPISKNTNQFSSINYSQKTYFKKDKGFVKYEKTNLKGEKEIIKLQEFN